MIPAGKGGDIFAALPLLIGWGLFFIVYWFVEAIKFPFGPLGFSLFEIIITGFPVMVTILVVLLFIFFPVRQKYLKMNRRQEERIEKRQNFVLGVWMISIIIGLIHFVVWLSKSMNDF